MGNETKVNQTQQEHVYTDDEFYHIKDEFEQIQKFIGMYISYKETRGALHLFKEIFNNALDECINPRSGGNKIDVFVDETSRQFTVVDNGRGIPFNEMVSICTEKHTSTKVIGLKQNVSFTGQNGVGIKVAVALSDYFSMTCYRGYEEKTIEFIDCKMVNHPIKKRKKEKHGTEVSCIPSEKYLGKINYTIDDFIDWLRRIGYIMPDGISIKFVGNKKDSEAAVYRTFTHTGLSENVSDLSQSREFMPIELSTETDTMQLNVAFSYDRTLDEELINSYCNFVYTVDGGYHEIAARRAICNFFVREARKLDPNNKFEVTFDDCRKGLIIAVNCQHIDPEFGGQTKEKVDNKDIQTDGIRGLTSSLYQYFNNNNALLRKIVTYLRQISKIRGESHKIKGIENKKPTTFLDDSEIRKFYNVSDRNKQGYKELLICEGDSAADAVVKMRNPKTQAIMGLLGVLNNSFNLETNKVTGKKTLKELITVLGCGFPKCDINKLKFDRIIILSDGDTDGDNITSLICAFFIKHLPEVIQEGRLYKSVPPLYMIDDKKIKTGKKHQNFLFDRREYIELQHKLIAENVDIMLVYSDKDIQKLSNGEKLAWLNLNRSYVDELDYLVKRAAAPWYVLEKVCYAWIMSDQNETKFEEIIHNLFPEMTYDAAERSLYGAVEGEFISLIIDSLFLKVAKRFCNILRDNPCFNVASKNKKAPDLDYDTQTIGAFLKEMLGRYTIDVDKRFKGIGEIPSELVFISTLNPKIRKLIKLTMKDAESALKIMQTLHGSGSAEERRDLLDNADISFDDLDN